MGAGGTYSHFLKTDWTRFKGVASSCFKRTRFKIVESYSCYSLKKLPENKYRTIIDGFLVSVLPQN